MRVSSTTRLIRSEIIIVDSSRKKSSIWIDGLLHFLLELESRRPVELLVKQQKNNGAETKREESFRKKRKKEKRNKSQKAKVKIEIRMQHGETINDNGTSWYSILARMMVVHRCKWHCSPSNSSYLDAELAAYAAPDAKFFRELKNPLILQLGTPLFLLHRHFHLIRLLLYAVHPPFSRSRDSWSADLAFIFTGSRPPPSNRCVPSLARDAFLSRVWNPDANVLPRCEEIVSKNNIGRRYAFRISREAPLSFEITRCCGRTGWLLYVMVVGRFEKSTHQVELRIKTAISYVSQPIYEYGTEYGYILYLFTPVNVLLLLLANLRTNDRTIFNAFRFSATREISLITPTNVRPPVNNSEWREHVVFVCAAHGYRCRNFFASIVRARIVEKSVDSCNSSME